MNFERGKNINEAIGIGVFGRRTFEDDFEATEFIIEHLNEILDIKDLDELPDHILKGSHYYEKMVKYTVDCIDVKLGNFRSYTYSFPDESLVSLVFSRVNSKKILERTLKMAEEKGYHVIRKG